MKLRMQKKEEDSRFTIQDLGFTLLETLAALSVLTFAIVGPLSLASYTIRSASLSQNQLTAFYLAQEAVEYIKNRRDVNALTDPTGNWLDGLGNCQGVKGCTIDVPNDDVNNCPGPPDTPCPKVKYESATGLYNQTTGADTIFTREVRLSNIETYEAKIEVIISWEERGINKSFTLEENILDWP